MRFALYERLPGLRAVRNDWATTLEGSTVRAPLGNASWCIPRIQVNENARTQPSRPHRRACDQHG